MNLVPLSEAAQVLNVKSSRPGRWLREYVQRREEETGRPILRRVGKGRGRPTYRVNMAELRVVAPELFDPREPMVEATRALMLAIQRRDARIDERLDEIEAILGVLLEAVRLRRAG